MTGGLVATLGGSFVTLGVLRHIGANWCNFGIEAILRQFWVNFGASGGHEEKLMVTRNAGKRQAGSVAWCKVHGAIWEKSELRVFAQF